MTTPRISRVIAPACLAAIAMSLSAASAAQAGFTTAPWGDYLEATFGPQLPERVDSLPGPRPMTLDFKSTSLGPDGTRPRDPRRVVVRFPRGARYNGHRFPRCRLRMAPECPRGSKIGKGTALAQWPDMDEPWRITFRLFNGPLRGGNPTELYFATTPIGTHLTFLGVARDDPEGPYGTAVVYDIAKILGPVPAYSITKFDVRSFNRSVVRGTGSRRRRIPIYSAPARCSGSWSFAYDYVFASGELLRATDEVACTPE